MVDTEVRYMITEKGRQALAEAEQSKLPAGEIWAETLIVYGWLSEDGQHDRVCTLKGEAKVDGPSLGMAPEDYLATNLETDIREKFIDTEGLEGQLIRAAIARVNWGQIAEWAMRDDQMFPPVDVGDLEE